MQHWRDVRRKIGGDVGFVPTMGALHKGHASLLHCSVENNDVSVMSIYVNPTQFNDPADLQNYPSTMKQDLQLAESIGVDYVILPSDHDIYPDGFRYQVIENEFSRQLCGVNRAGHFTGVLTVVMKLLNMVKPRRAYFGKKDYQQYVLIKDMCAAFCMDVEIVGCETVRERDGLAMSSRNKLLSEPARAVAHKFKQALSCAPAKISADQTLADQKMADQLVADRLAAYGFQVDYVETRKHRRFGAIVVEGRNGQVRLIDNVELESKVIGGDQ
ncbi:MAG: pantoate--beta-alanine ligase [Gammaproteobacteria bacterium]|nr:pantoate--beta-alanine ligase [Gammaproteobacteria bacterium]